jgi:hypothetical protein
VDGQEWWTDGREKFSKEGLVYRTFSPWELRGDMLDGQELWIQPTQALHFSASGLSPEAKKSMPHTMLLWQSIDAGETISVGAVTNGVAAGEGVGVEEVEAPNLLSIFSDTHEGVYVNSHLSLVLKCHEVGTQAFSFQLKENVEIISCDYFAQRVQVQLQSTPARRKSRTPLVCLFSHCRLNH